MSADVVMFSTRWCGYCVRLKRFLDENGIAHRVVDIEEDPGAAEFVMGINGGNRTVPTLAFPDGRVATNPTPAQVLELIRAAG